MVERAYVQRSNPTDDDLWRAIAENTDAMSALIHQQFQLDAGGGAANEAGNRAKLKLSTVQTIDKFDANIGPALLSFVVAIPIVSSRVAGENSVAS